MKKITLSIILLSFFVIGKAQQISMNLSEISASIKTENFSGNNQTVLLKVGSESDKTTLISSGSLTVQVKIKVRDYDGTRRSNMKKSMVRIFITYYFEYKGMKSKRVEERMFFMDDKRKFEENVKQIFQQGIKNTVLNVKFNGEIPE